MIIAPSSHKWVRQTRCCTLHHVWRITNNRSSHNSPLTRQLSLYLHGYWAQSSEKLRNKFTISFDCCVTFAIAPQPLPASLPLFPCRLSKKQVYRQQRKRLLKIRWWNFWKKRELPGRIAYLTTLISGRGGQHCNNLWPTSLNCCGKLFYGEKSEIPSSLQGAPWNRSEKHGLPRNARKGLEDFSWASCCLFQNYSKKAERIKQNFIIPVFLIQSDFSHAISPVLLHAWLIRQPWKTVVYQLMRCMRTKTNRAMSQRLFAPCGLVSFLFSTVGTTLTSREMNEQFLRLQSAKREVFKEVTSKKGNSSLASKERGREGRIEWKDDNIW